MVQADERSAVLLDDDASPEEIAEVERLVREAGLDLTVSATYGQKGALDNPAVMLIISNVSALLDAFAYDAFKTWIKRMRSARRRKPGQILNSAIEDQETHTRYILRDDLPDVAYRALRESDHRKHRGDWLYWDERRKLWLPPDFDSE